MKNKNAKVVAAKKNAEALKAKKKQERETKASSAPKTNNGKKGKSIIGQAKKKK